MEFEIKMNTKSVFNEEKEGNYLLVLDEKEMLNNNEVIQEVLEEFSINNIVDAKKIIKEISQFSSFDEFYSSLELIDAVEDA